MDLKVFLIVESNTYLQSLFLRQPVSNFLRSIDYLQAEFGAIGSD